MNKILIIAEHNGIEINSSTSKCVSCAANIPNSQIDIAVFAKNGDELANQASKICNTHIDIYNVHVTMVARKYLLSINALQIIKKSDQNPIANGTEADINKKI